MKYLSFALAFTAIFFASSCHKCYDCNQYCAYCEPVNNTGVVYKICASKEVTHSRIDSIYFAMKNTGYDCALLDENKKVCDRSAKLDEAVEYYQRQDYYCYPQE